MRELNSAGTTRQTTKFYGPPVAGEGLNDILGAPEVMALNETYATAVEEGPK